MSQPIYQCYLRKELIFIRVNISAFEYDFKTLKFKNAENSVQINVYSAVLQFVLSRFISSKKFRSYLILDGIRKALEHYFLEVSVPNELSVNTN